MEKLDSMELFKAVLSMKNKIYEDVETIIHIICVAATSMRVEYIVESWVSVYESHSSKHRPISNERAELEVFLAVNGPILPHADCLIEEAIRSMFRYNFYHYGFSQPSVLKL